LFVLCNAAPHIVMIVSDDRLTSTFDVGLKNLRAQAAD